MKSGHYPNISNVLLDIYRLLTIFMASRAIAELETPWIYGEDPLRLFSEIESDELTRILLTVAITVRVIDDRELKTMELVAESCGRLITDTSQPNRLTDLSIREACNKIVHATKIEFDRGTLPDDRTFLQPKIRLSGIWPQKPWQADIDVIKFSRECASFLNILSQIA